MLKFKKCLLAFMAAGMCCNNTLSLENLNFLSISPKYQGLANIHARYGIAIVVKANQAELIHEYWACTYASMGMHRHCSQGSPFLFPKLPAFCSFLFAPCQKDRIKSL